MIDGWRWPGKGAGVSRALLEVDSSDGWYQIAHPDQVVGCGGKGEGPTDPGDSTMTSLAQSGDGLEPAEDLFHSLAPPLTERVAGMASGAAVDRAVDLLRDVRGDVVGPQCAHQFLLIVTLVGAQRDPALAKNAVLVLRPVGMSGIEVTRHIEGEELVWRYHTMFTARLRR